jgi:enoyl-CoA hydratase
MPSLLRYTSDGLISTITLDDGKANVLSVEMLGQLNAALDRAESDKCAVLITGREGMFSGGFDLGVFRSDREQVFRMLRAGAELTERLLAFPAPVVGACSGHAIAMGAFLLLSTDVRIGVKGGPFKIAVNEVQIGMTLPRFAVEVCRQRLTPAAFNRALITAEPHDHDRALEAGFLDYVAPAAEFQEAARGRAQALASLVRDAYIATKRRVREQTLTALRKAIELDLADWRARG